MTASMGADSHSSSRRDGSTASRRQRRNRSPTKHHEGHRTEDPELARQELQHPVGVECDAADGGVLARRGAWSRSRGWHSTGDSASDTAAPLHRRTQPAPTTAPAADVRSTRPAAPAAIRETPAPSTSTASPHPWPRPRRPTRSLRHRRPVRAPVAYRATARNIIMIGSVEMITDDRLTAGMVMNTAPATAPTLTENSRRPASSSSTDCRRMDQRRGDLHAELGVAEDRRGEPR
jgi:hypothetical protein